MEFTYFGIEVRIKGNLLYTLFDDGGVEVFSFSIDANIPAISFFVVQSILIVVLVNNNYMKSFSYLQSSSSDVMELLLGIIIVLLNLVAVFVIRKLYLSGLDAERFLIVIFSMYGIFNLINSLYNTSLTVEKETISIVISMFIGVIFTILFSALTILEEIKNNKPVIK